MKRVFSIFILFILIISSVSALDVCDVEPESPTCETIKPNETMVVSSPNISHSPDSICIVYFYGEGCPKCAEINPHIKELEQKYGDKISITKYEIYNNINNYKLYSKYCVIKNIPIEERGVPFVAVGDKYFIGVEQIKKNLGLEIENLLRTGERLCPLKGEMSCHEVEYNQTDISPAIPNLIKEITLPLILVTGLIDGINPCAFAIIIFLLAFLLEISNSRKRMIKAGVAYIIGGYLAYFLIGVSALSLIQISGFSNVLVKASAIIAIFVGLINVKDFFWYGRWFSLKIPEGRKHSIEGLIRRANTPVAFVIGFFVSVHALPCSGGVYLAIIAMLANSITKVSGIFYLLLYNIMFVLPLVIILIAVSFGMKAEHIEKWRQSKKNWMKLIMGLLLLLLGSVMLLGLI